MAAQRRDTGRADVPDLFGPACLCNGCSVVRCADRDLHARDSLLAWVNGYSVGCSEYQPETWRGIEGVRP
jgi:hypothetical protein